jgi:hypothetical protein
MSETTETMPARIRGVAIAAACVAGAFLMFLSLLGPIFSAPLILGALIQPRSPRSGRCLMWVGAVVLSCMSLFLSIKAVLGGIRYFDLMMITIYLVSVATTILVTWCDVELILDAVRLTRTVRISKPRPTFVGEGLVWLAAIGLSAWVIPGIPWTLRAPPPDYPRASHLINLALSLPIQLVVIAFDVWLIIRAIQMWRAQQAGE